MKRIILIFICLFLSNLTFSQNTVNDFLAKGKELYESKNYEEALVTFKQGLAIAPKNYELNKSAGDSYHKLEKFKEAISFYNKAEKVNKKDAKTIL